MAGELWAAGAPIPDAEALIRRYCGLPGPHGDAETWGYAFYEARPSPPGNEVTADTSFDARVNMVASMPVQ